MATHMVYKNYSELNEKNFDLKVFYYWIEDMLKIGYIYGEMNKVGHYVIDLATIWLIWTPYDWFLH